MLKVGSIPRWGRLHLLAWTVGTPSTSHPGVGLSVAVRLSESCQLNLPIGSTILVGLGLSEAAH